MNISKTYLKELVYNVNGAAIEVHKALGPGLLEKIYQQCMEHELKQRNVHFESEMLVPVMYKGKDMETMLRCDLFIENTLVVELKAVTTILPIHEAQLLTYMNLLNVPEGLLINFNVLNIFKQGQRTYVNELYRKLPS